MSLIDIYEDPDLAARLATAAVDRFGVDAAGVVTDVRLPLLKLGLVASLEDGEQTPASPSPAAPARRPRPSYDHFGRLAETVSLTRQLVGGRAAVLGVVGAPFSMACAMLDPVATAAAENTKRLLFGRPDEWHELADYLVQVAVLAADVQVSAGAHALHVFDTWAGALDEEDYRRHVLPWSRQLFAALEHFGVPTIHFALGTGHLAEAVAEAGGDVIGLDWREPLDEAWDRVGLERGVQGNLDPTLLLGPLDRALAAAGDILFRASGRPGHIFGVGHGLLPSTSPTALHTLVRYVHTFNA